MKPITNILLVLALVCYVFLPLFDISYMGSINGLGFTSSVITYNFGFKGVVFALTPFITVFLAIGFNCLRSRWWGIIDVVLIFLTIYFFLNLLAKFQGFSLVHDPAVITGTELNEGMSIRGLGSGFFSSLALIVLAFLSAIISLMPFKFNKRLEEKLDNRLASGKRRLSKMGEGISGELERKSKHAGNAASDSESSSSSEHHSASIEIEEEPRDQGTH